MPRYNQLIKSDYPTPINDQEEFKPQVGKMNATNALIWNKIEELKKLLGQDRAVLNNTLTSANIAPAVYSLFSFSSPLVYNATTGVVGLATPIAVQYGGTGASSLTDHGILLGSGTGAITPLGVATNGQMPIGSTGADPVLALPLGTANQVTVTPGAGSLTFSLPQNIHTAAIPTFAGITLTGFSGLLLGTAGVTSAITAVDGDVVIGNATPTWARLGISIPAVNVRNVFGVDNGELRPSWKTALDGTAPEAITIGAAGSAGTSLVFSHRDHVHASPATWTATAHDVLSGIHGDALAGSVVDGDVIIGNVTPKWSRLAVSVPAANVRNVFGIDNGELRPSWKTSLDATLPETITIGGAGSAGTSLVYSHRDHNHPAPATWIATAHNLLSAIHGDTTAGACVIGDLVVGGAGPAWTKLADVAVGQVLQSGGVGVLPAWTPTAYLSGSLVIGNTPIVAGSLLELYSAAANPIMTITGAHATDYDPQIQFRTDAVPTVKWYMGVDATTDNFMIDHVALGGATAPIEIDYTTGYIGFNAGPITGSPNARHYFYDARTNMNWYNMWVNLRSTVTGATVTVSNWALAFGTQITASATNNQGSMVGIYGYSLVYGGNGRTKNVCGIQAQHGNYTGTAGGIIDNSVGIWIDVRHSTAGFTISNSYDIYVNTPISTGATVTNEWCIYSLHVAPSQFAGDLRIAMDGTTTTGRSTWGAANDSAIFYNGTNTVFATLVGSAIYVFDGYTTVDTDCRVVLGAGEAKDAILDFVCDEGDDALDTFRLRTVYNATSANNTLDWQVLTVLPSTFATAFRMYTTGQLSLVLDSLKFTLGAGNDFGLSYDGTYGLIDSSLVAASDIRVTCGANKTIELQNVVYDDLYADIAPETTGAGKPTLAAFSGNINKYTFAVNDVSEVGTIELKHDWKEGTAIEIHVHWATNGLNDATVRGVKWEVDYTWANIQAAGGTIVLGAATTISLETSIAAAEPDKTHKYTSVGSFTPAGGKIAAALLLSLKRIASVTNVAPANNPWGLMIGVHYQIDTLGSRQQVTK